MEVLDKVDDVVRELKNDDEKLAALGDKLDDFGDDLKEKVGGFFKKFDRD